MRVDQDAPWAIRKFRLATARTRSQFLSSGTTGTVTREPMMEHAEVIVAGGRGLGGPDGLPLLEELATVLGGVVGVSRPLVDAGWISADHQVGQTGKTVRPKLYVAAGISGAVQHRVGMS